MSTNTRIFISHAKKDEKLVDAFMDLLTSGLNINSDQVFCASLEGQGVTTGEDFIDFIKDEIETAEVVISILSENYYESAFCICELGASWVIAGKHMPIIVPPMEFSDIEAVLVGLHAREIDNGSDLSEIKDELESLLSLEVIKTARWETKKDQFLRKAVKIIPTLPTPNTVSFEEYEKEKEKYEAALDDIDELKEKIDEKNRMISELKECKDREEAKEVLKKYSTVEEKYDVLLKNAEEEVIPFPHVTVEALFYHLRNEPIEIYDENRESIKWCIECEFLEGEIGSRINPGYVELNVDHPKIEKALDALYELRDFINETTDKDDDEYEDKYKDFVEDFRERNDYNLSFTSRTFWQENLTL